MATSQDFVNWICSPALLPGFLMKAFLAEGEHLRDFGKGTVHTTIYFPEVLAFHIALPPVNEQRRIVAKLDALMAKSRRAKEALDAIPPLLDKLRQSILAAAFRGDLTADWRAAHPDVEPASQLLQRIRAERRRRWEEAELAKLRAKGKTPTDDRWKAKYQEPEPVDESGLPELPEGWCWASGEEVVMPGADIVYGIVQPGPVISDGVPYVRGMDIKDGRINESVLLRTHPTIAEKYARASLTGGDVLLGIIRATKVAVVPESLKGANITQGTARFRPGMGVRTHYLAGWLAGPDAQRWLHERYRGIDMPGLNLKDVRRIPVPLAPLAEQEAIEATIATAQEHQLRLKLAVDQAIEGSSRIESAILAKAFRGELVPQDPNDEPASVLLERIRSESGVQAKPRGRRARSKTA